MMVIRIYKLSLDFENSFLRPIKMYSINMGMYCTETRTCNDACIEARTYNDACIEART